MSDDDFLIDDEIYALATTGSDKKRKKRASEGKGTRKRARTEYVQIEMTFCANSNWWNLALDRTLTTMMERTIHTHLRANIKMRRIA
jgi:hypothetical protein